ncbi:F-actin-capping protein subunit alpha [Nilaparvata lugens]|uniref:F-actin-capping protein subunit alpha n=1 Tax=Nilaparvata lugens TaxID=108931 RepID=UPI000B986EB8|nr:F-actin-capping protein subunit alpha [Nilaparvata lugens]
MSSGYEDEATIDDSEKVQIVSNFILHTPPGELDDVLSDIQVLVNDAQVFKTAVMRAVATYNKDQFIPAHVPDADQAVLVTEFNDLGSHRFFDPRSKQSFRFDHIKKVASECKPWKPDDLLESWRSCFEEEVDLYTSKHYKNGVACVFPMKEDSKNKTFILNICIEDHQFQPVNYWNGRWRSYWTVRIQPGANIQISGVLKVQVHYYEDGNVQLVTSKDYQVNFDVESKLDASKRFIEFVEECENSYQLALAENYKTMSDTTFKALRRQLPVTRSLIDWSKIVLYSVGKELKE